MISSFFPEISSEQNKQFDLLTTLYKEWNQKINVISRKDIENFETHHLLYSLGIAKSFRFEAGTTIMDAGTGGGLPGIPLAILFPQVEFTLVDSIAKKIYVVEEITAALSLKNIRAVRARFEDLGETFDFVTGRAVTALPDLFGMLKNKVRLKGNNSFKNGIIYLKGGVTARELDKIPSRHKVIPLSDWFEDPFFETKQIVYLYDFK